MSKRYGRNQKRDHRARIARLEAIVAERDRRLQHLSANLAMVEARARELGDVVRDVTYCLGPNFIGLPPAQVAAELPRPPPDWSFRMAAPGGKIAAFAFPDVHQHGDYLRDMQHIHVRFGSGVAAYGLTRMAMEDLDPVLLARRVAEGLARVLLAQWRGDEAARQAERGHPIRTRPRGPGSTPGRPW